VEGVPARDMLDEQVRPGQLGQQRPHPRWEEASEAGCGRGGGVGAGVQSEQPEQPGRVGGQGVVGPGEHRP
jgi:hypothetical protein